MRPQHAFTLLELLVVISIVMVLAGVMVATVTVVREAARTSACASNLRQIGLAQIAYADDWEGRFTDLYIAGNPTSQWIRRLDDYIANNRFDGVFTCATFRSLYGLDRNHRRPPGLVAYPAYGLNAIPYYFTKGQLHNPIVTFLYQNSILRSADTILIAEGGAVDGELVQPSTGFGSPASGWVLGAANPPDLRHKGGNNYAFADGHVEFRRGEPANPSSPSASPWRSW